MFAMLSIMMSVTLVFIAYMVIVSAFKNRNRNRRKVVRREPTFKKEKERIDIIKKGIHEDRPLRAIISRINNDLNHCSLDRYRPTSTNAANDILKIINKSIGPLNKENAPTNPIEAAMQAMRALLMGDHSHHCLVNLVGNKISDDLETIHFIAVDILKMHYHGKMR